MAGWKGAFFVSFVDLWRLKSKRSKKTVKQTKNAPFHARTGNET